MIHAQRCRRVFELYAFVSITVAVWCAAGALGVQAPYDVPATHERQCVPTGEIPPGVARTIAVNWRHPFATGEYDIVGSVSEPGDDRQAIELAHIVMPHTPTMATAVVFNRNANAPQSAVLCLDASAE
ncbi:MAG TPA: hypothetical protein VN812_04600 [Candidatus Acidoferrales bacterium]|nr:hypothetical protein [Candidatus Acidoferrales bacterium]